MNATAFEDRRRPVDQLIGNYAEDHRNPTNQLVHWICVPLIVWCVFAWLWALPVPASLAKPGLWAGLAMAFSLAWYFRLSRNLALAVLVAFVGYALLTGWLHSRLGSGRLAWTALVVFVLAWIGQFIGHHIEGRRPSFFTDLKYLLVGPIYLMAKVLRRAGIAY
jgi:uncharacterized membrane protein YGL010W